MSYLRDPEVEVIERHIHSFERWFEVATTPSGQSHIADRISAGAGAFEVDAGNDTWGSWLQILGSSDTPNEGSNLFYDMHRLLISAVERNGATHFIQIGYGSSGSAALSAKTYTEVIFTPASAKAEDVALFIQGLRTATGTNAWIRIMIPGQNTGTLNFCFGLHEYEE